MRRRANFDMYWGDRWPDIDWLGTHFLTTEGRRKLFQSGNDSWGLCIEGVDGTDDLLPLRGRIDIDLTILGHESLGVLLFYMKWGGTRSESYYSKGDLSRLHQWTRTAHDDLMPVGLFIPFETAWSAIEEFMKSDGALPTGIAWISARDLPDGVFPRQWEQVPTVDR
jgi:hypothetical protein